MVLQFLCVRGPAVAVRGDGCISMGDRDNSSVTISVGQMLSMSPKSMSIIGMIGRSERRAFFLRCRNCNMLVVVEN